MSVAEQFRAFLQTQPDPAVLPLFSPSAVVKEYPNEVQILRAPWLDAAGMPTHSRAMLIEVGFAQIGHSVDMRGTSFRDGSKTFWAPAAEVGVDKRYERLASIRSLREYAEKARESGGYVPRFGVDYCGGICPVGGHRCTADHPCHDCQ